MLDHRQLEAFNAVVEHGSFRAAAAALSLTLAAVSLRIKSLEESLGQRLLVRGKAVRATAAGQALLAHVRQVRLMEADLLGGLQGGGEAADAWQSLSVAINADSAAGWFLHGVAPLLQRHRLLLEIVIDDQDHTHDLLKSGDVIGCVSTLAEPMRGCVAEPLGVMRYRCVAAPAVAQRCRSSRGAVSVHQLLAQPAIIFNRKDALQDAFLLQHFGLKQPNYPRHYAPAVDAFETAIELGLGWGMVPEQHLARRPGLQELLPGATVDVTLYWQHWTREPLSAQRLTQAVKAAAHAALPPVSSG
jgi:LysR family transcriptional regulator (chromosome initiation inhibitor)